MSSSEIVSIVFAVLGFVTTVLAIIFAILTYAKGRRREAVESSTGTAVKIAKIETDIAYIREKLDQDAEWKHDIENRVRRLEAKKKDWKRRL